MAIATYDTDQMNHEQLITKRIALRCVGSNGDKTSGPVRGAEDHLGEDRGW